MKHILFSTLLMGALVFSGAGVAAAAPQHEAHGRFRGGTEAHERGRFERNHGRVVIAPFYGGFYDPFWYGWGAPYYYGAYGTVNPYVGGIRLDVKPHTGDVFVDGSYAGKVDEYNGAFQSLDLAPGSHHIEIRTPGYQALSFDTYIQPEHTTHYKARLAPLT